MATVEEEEEEETLFVARIISIDDSLADKSVFTLVTAYKYAKGKISKSKSLIYGRNCETSIAENAALHLYRKRNK